MTTKERLRNWLLYLDGVDMEQPHSLSSIYGAAVRSGHRVPSLYWLKAHQEQVLELLSPLRSAWYADLAAGERHRFAPWVRALLDLHYYMVLVAGGLRSYRFISSHADVYAQKIYYNYAARNIPQTTVEYLERTRITRSAFWTNIEQFGYPMWEPQPKPEGNRHIPGCHGRCEINRHLLNEALIGNLQMVQDARYLLDVSVGFCLPWLPIKDELVCTDDKYEVALAKYLGLEVSDVHNNS